MSTERRDAIITVLRKHVPPLTLSDIETLATEIISVVKKAQTKRAPTKHKPSKSKSSRMTGVPHERT